MMPPRRSNRPEDEKLSLLFSLIESRRRKKKSENDVLVPQFYYFYLHYYYYYFILNDDVLPTLALPLYFPSTGKYILQGCLFFKNTKEWAFIYERTPLGSGDDVASGYSECTCAWSNGAEKHEPRNGLRVPH